MARWEVVAAGALASILLGGTAWGLANGAQQSTAQGEAPTPGPAPENLTAESPADDAIPVVAEKIKELGAGNGLVSQRTDYEARGIAVTWSGDVPRQLEDYASSRPYGVEIRFEAGGPYSKEVAEEARGRLERSEATSRLGVVGISVLPTGAGLELSTTRDSLSSEQVAELQEAAGVPVFLVYGVSEPRGY